MDTMSDASSANLPVSPAEGRHLCGLLVLTLTDDSPVGTGVLADSLGVSGPTVTETIKTLDEAGLVTYEPYVGVELAPRGERIARDLFWRRCLVQQFFETVDISLDTEQAYRIGRTVPSGELSRLDDQLSRPCDRPCEATDALDCERLVSR